MTNIVVGKASSAYDSWKNLPDIEGEIAVNSKIYKINEVKARTYTGPLKAIRVCLYIVALVATLGLASYLSFISNLKNSTNIVHFVSEIKADKTQPKTPVYLIAFDSFIGRETDSIKRFLPESRFETHLISTTDKNDAIDRVEELLKKTKASSPKPLIALVNRAVVGHHFFGSEGTYSLELEAYLRSLTATGQVNMKGYITSDNGLIPSYGPKQSFFDINAIDPKTGINKTLFKVEAATT